MTLHFSWHADNSACKRALTRPTCSSSEIDVSHSTILSAMAGYPLQDNVALQTAYI